MKNTVTLVGFVGNNPEVRTTQGGAAITSISLATSRSYKDGEGNRKSETEWHRITCFNGVGKSVAEHVTKGAMVMVTGRIHYTSWGRQEGPDPVRLRDRRRAGRFPRQGQGSHRRGTEEAALEVAPPHLDPVA